jgi:hypothetical protein
MKREEEIKNYAYNNCINDDVDDTSYSLIVETARWADGTMIDKVCKWLESTDIDMEYWSSEDGVCKELLIEDIKKVMEGRL